MSAVLLGIALVAAALSAVWPRLMVLRALTELRESPDLVLEYYVSNDPHQAQAAQRFLDEREGQEVVFREYLDEYDRSEAAWGVQRLMKHWAKNGHRAGFLALHADGIEQSVRKSLTGFGSFGQMSSGPKDPERRALLLELIDRCEGSVFTHPGLATFVFRIVRVEGKEVTEPLWPGERPEATEKRGVYRDRGRARHVCFFRIDPDGRIPSDG